MYKLTVPLSELVARLISLNEDRRAHYNVFGHACRNELIKVKFGELAWQSISNLEELNELEMAPGKYSELCGSYKVPSLLWVELKRVLNHKDLFIVAGRIKKIEDQVSIMYHLVFRMLVKQDEEVAGMIRNQFETQLRSMAQLPDLFIHFN